MEGGRRGKNAGKTLRIPLAWQWWCIQGVMLIYGNEAGRNTTAAAVLIEITYQMNH